MTIEEAIAVLTVLPIGRVARLEVPERSVIVCEVARPLKQAEAIALAEQLKRLWPDQRVVVCEQHVHLSTAEIDP